MSMTLLQILATLLFGIGIAFIITKTDLARLMKERKWQHIVFGAATCVFVLWLFRISIYDGLIIHFLWLSTLTLVLGFRWSMLVGSFVLLMSTVIGNDAWHMIGVNGLIGVFLPIIVTYAVFSYSFHRIYRQLFVYIFVCAFFPGALTIALKMLGMSAYYLADGLYPSDVIYYNYTQMTILMMFPEAFFNGFSMTCLIVYKPDLVATFSDKFYIDGK